MPKASPQHLLHASLVSQTHNFLVFENFFLVVRDHIEDRRAYDPLEVEREQKVIVGLLLEVNHNHHHDDNEILKNKI